MTRRGLPLSAWPEPDRIAWAGAIAEGDIFDGRGPAAHWANTTRNGVVSAYGRWLGFLAEAEPKTLALQPVERLTEDLLRRYLCHLAQTAGTVGQHMFFAKLRDAVRAMFPGKIPRILSQLVRHLEHKCQPRSLAARVVTTHRLIVLSKSLMRQAAGSDGNITDLVAYRDGLMVGLLASRPLRRRTFSLIRVHTHLCRVGSEWRLRFDGSETKSRRRLETSVPEWIIPFLERYLREVRPRFLGANQHDGLWVSTKDGSLTDDAIYRIITTRTHAAFGQPVNPHLFRSCAVTTIAMRDPGRIGVGTDLLHHVSLATTHAHYKKAHSIEASRLYARVLAGACVPVERDHGGAGSTRRPPRLRMLNSKSDAK